VCVFVNRDLVVDTWTMLLGKMMEFLPWRVTITWVELVGDGSDEGRKKSMAFQRGRDYAVLVVRWFFGSCQRLDLSEGAVSVHI
jgi:hypothetical protein